MSINNLSSFTKERLGLCIENDTIASNLYEEYGVKRGLRDLNGMRMLFSNSVLSVAMFTKDSSNLMLESKKFRKLHHSSKIAVLSSCWAS